MIVRGSRLVVAGGAMVVALALGPRASAVPTVPDTSDLATYAGSAAGSFDLTEAELVANGLLLTADESPGFHYRPGSSAPILRYFADVDGDVLATGPELDDADLVPSVYTRAELTRVREAAAAIALGEGQFTAIRYDADADVVSVVGNLTPQQLEVLDGMRVVFTAEPEGGRLL